MKEEIFVGEKNWYFSEQYTTFCTDFNFVVSGWLGPLALALGALKRGHTTGHRRNFCMGLVLFFDFAKATKLIPYIKCLALQYIVDLSSLFSYRARARPGTVIDQAAQRPWVAHIKSSSPWLHLWCSKRTRVQLHGDALVNVGLSDGAGTDDNFRKAQRESSVHFKSLESKWQWFLLRSSRSAVNCSRWQSKGVLRKSAEPVDDGVRYKWWGMAMAALSSCERGEGQLGAIDTIIRFSGGGQWKGRNYSGEFSDTLWQFWPAYSGDELRRSGIIALWWWGV